MFWTMTWVPSRYFPKGQTSQESALQIVVGCGHTQAAEPSPSCTVASIESLGSDSMDPAGERAQGGVLSLEI